MDSTPQPAQMDPIPQLALDSTSHPELEGTSQPELELTPQPALDSTSHPELEGTSQPELEGTPQPVQTEEIPRPWQVCPAAAKPVLLLGHWQHKVREVLANVPGQQPRK